ncbi:MAG: glycosyltransferase family A protein [Promethearchaeota archaeon]
MSRVLAVTEFFNEADNIPSLVENVAAQTVPPDLWLVMDDGSTDDSRALFVDNLETHGIPYHVHSMPPKQKPDANKKGVAFQSVDLLNGEWIRSRNFDYLLKIDADTRLPRTYTEFGLGLLDRLGGIGAMAGKIHGEAGSETPMGTAKFVRWEVVSATAGRYWDLDPDSLWNFIALQLGLRLLVLEDVRVWVTRPTHMVRTRGLYDYGRRMYYLKWSLPMALMYSVALFVKRDYALSFLRGYVHELVRGVWVCNDQELVDFYGPKRMVHRGIGAIPKDDKGVCIELGIKENDLDSLSPDLLDSFAAIVESKIEEH